MRNTDLKDLFHIFRTNDAVEVEDLADFQVILLDKEQPTQAAMAITALTIYQLEHGFDRGRFQMLLWAMSRHCPDEVRVRAIVGLLLICGRLDVKDSWALEQMAELLSYDNNNMAFEAWQAILRTAKPDVYDPNFEMLKPIYNQEPFTNAPELYFEPFERGKIENLDDYEWKMAELFFRTMNVCDSDKYALLLALRSYLPAIVQNLKEQDIDIDALEFVGINFQQIMMMGQGTGKRQLQKRAAELTPVESYVQQLYRFIRLSRHTPLRLTEHIEDLRKTMIDRMVVVGAAQIAQIEAI